MINTAKDLSNELVQDILRNKKLLERLSIVLNASPLITEAERKEVIETIYKKKYQQIEPVY